MLRITTGEVPKRPGLSAILRSRIGGRQPSMPLMPEPEVPFNRTLEVEQVAHKRFGQIDGGNQLDHHLS